MGKVLGKGLEAIIKTHNHENDDRYIEGKIDINKIIPNEDQPRQTFELEQMEELIQSIKKNGVLQPITVRELKNQTYQIIAGERRYRAAMQAKLKWIPAYTVTINDESKLMEYALIENIQRVNLNPIEEAEGYAVLRGKYNFSQQDIAKKVAKSRSEIANKMRLLKLPPIIKKGLRKNKIKYGHARALLTIKESTKMIVLYNKIIKNNLSVRATETMIKNSTINKPEIPTNNHASNEKKIQKLAKSLTPYLKTKIKSTINKNNSGAINIHFSSLEDLIRIIKKIKNEQ
tara:strand:+ start:41975 stop:42838 length:864 start_codon:yes stop_codon:yes gene_type:complete